MSALTENYSGIVIDQNALLASTSSAAFSQTFTLPADYVRGATATILPDLTGFQVYADVTSPTTCSLAWTLQVDDPLNGLQTISSGTHTGTAHSGPAWFGVMFEDTVPISPSWLTATFTLNLTAVTGMNLGYSAGPTLMYRILAAIADSGTDFLGNVYRSAAINTVATNIGIFQSPDIYAHWMSNPCPSKFGVEALYMDVREAGEGIVIDRLTVDPMTPGVFFHIYFSNDPTGPGTTPDSWEKLLWTPVYQTYQVNRMQTFALPDPILAKYICIEFTNLQARHYRAGNFQLPSIYKKYPKWVLEYFLSQFKTQGVDRLSSNVNITYDALDLAYSYYSTDIIQEPDPPLLSQVPVSPLNPFVNENLSNLDPKTLSKISLNFQPYLTQPALLGDGSSMLSDFGAANSFRTYTTEVISRAIGDTNTVSNVQRDALLIEKAFPAMFFYLPSRHTFRIAQANFDTDVAYFAGVKELVLHRDVYTGYGDQAQYNEILGDGTNLILNDLIQADALPPLPPPPPPPPPTCTSYLWWSEYGPNSTLNEANSDGTDIQPALITPDTPIAWTWEVCNDGTYLYWANGEDASSPAGEVGRAKLDGTEVINSFFTTFQANLSLVAVTSNYIFYSDNDQRLGRANLDGTGANDDWKDYGPGAVKSIAASPDWLYAVIGFDIVRLDPSTGASSTLITGEFAFVLAVNSTAIIFYNAFSGDIMTAALDGTGVTTLISSASVGSPLNLAVSDWHVFWTLRSGGIKRAAIDGTDVTTIVSGSDAATASGITIKDCAPPVPLLSPSLIV